MQTGDKIILTRDTDAILIPVGQKILLAEGTEVVITQALGGSCTINIQGNLARIDGKDIDALGIDMENINTVPKTADGPVDTELVWAQMRTCFDPEIPVNIVDLGLIYDCTATPLENGGNRVDVNMTLTAPGCGMGPVLVEDVKEKVFTVPNVTEVHVELVFDPPWSQEMMSDTAKLQTGMMW